MGELVWKKWILINLRHGIMTAQEAGVFKNVTAVQAMLAEIADRLEEIDDKKRSGA